MHEIAGKLKKTQSIHEKNKLAKNLINSGAALGLLQNNPKNWFEIGTEAKKTKLINKKAIEILIKKRETARKNKNYTESDKIRDQLLAAGIILEDNAETTHWRRT